MFQLSRRKMLKVVGGASAIGAVGASAAVLPMIMRTSGGSVISESNVPVGFFEDTLYLSGGKALEKVKIFLVAPPKEPGALHRNDTVYVSHTPLGLAVKMGSGDVHWIPSCVAYSERVKRLIILKYQQLGFVINPNQIVVESPDIQSVVIADRAKQQYIGGYRHKELPTKGLLEDIPLGLIGTSPSELAATVELKRRIRPHVTARTSVSAEFIASTVSSLAGNQKLIGPGDVSKFIASHRAEVEGQIKSHIESSVYVEEAFPDAEKRELDSYLANIAPSVVNSILSGAETHLLADVAAILKSDNRADDLALVGVSEGTESVTGGRSETAGDSQRSQSSTSSTAEGVVGQQFGMTTAAAGGVNLGVWNVGGSFGMSTAMSSSLARRIAVEKIASAEKHGESAVVESHVRAINKLRGVASRSTQSIRVTGATRGAVPYFGNIVETETVWTVPLHVFSDGEELNQFIASEVNASLGSVIELAAMCLRRCAEVESAYEVLTFIEARIDDDSVIDQSGSGRRLSRLYQLFAEHRVTQNLEELSPLQATRILESDLVDSKWKTKAKSSPGRDVEMAISGTLEVLNAEFDSAFKHMNVLVDRLSQIGNGSTDQLIDEAKLLSFARGARNKLETMKILNGRTL